MASAEKIVKSCHDETYHRCDCNVMEQRKPMVVFFERLTCVVAFFWKVCMRKNVFIQMILGKVNLREKSTDRKLSLSLDCSLH